MFDSELSAPPIGLNHARLTLSLSRQCVQGLSDDVSINKFFDDPMLLELARQDVMFGSAY